MCSVSCALALPIEWDVCVSIEACFVVVSNDVIVFRIVVVSVARVVTFSSFERTWLCSILIYLCVLLPRWHWFVNSKCHH